MPENNAMAVDVQGGTIFSAAGDSCAYGWDVVLYLHTTDIEKGCIKTVFKGHTDYLQCIIARNSSNQIITGSEDGTARLWDNGSWNSLHYKIIMQIMPTYILHSSGITAVAGYGGVL